MNCENRYYALILALLVITTVATSPVCAETAAEKEYQVKAAFIYNFIKFTDWPQEKMRDTNDLINIGVIGNKDFIKAFDPIKEQRIKNRRIVIKYFDGFGKIKDSKKKDNSLQNSQIEAIKKCHVLFFCISNSEEIENSEQILKTLEGSSVLTVGEMAGFIEAGGVINLFIEGAKVRFEVNMKASDKNKLTISSSLLRLAARIVKDSESSNDKKK